MKRVLKSPWTYLLPACLAAYFFVPKGFALAHHEHTQELLLVIVNISAISLGFIMTAKSILISIASGRVMRTLAEAGHLDELLGIFNTCIALYFTEALLSGAMVMLLDVKRVVPYYDALFAIWGGILFTTLFSTVRVFTVYSKILRVNLKQQRG